MRGRIGPSQADGNPALPQVVVPHCLSAGYLGFGASLSNSAPSGGCCHYTRWTLSKYLHLWYFLNSLTLPCLNIPLSCTIPYKPVCKIMAPVLNPSPLLANHNHQNPALCTLAQLFIQTLVQRVLLHWQEEKQDQNAKGQTVNQEC